MKTTVNLLPPAYANILAQRLADPASWRRWAGTSADGTHVTFWVAHGPDAWNWAQKRISHRLLLAAPPGQDPCQFDWSILVGHDPVILVSCGVVDTQDVRSLIVAMMRDGVTRVLHGENSCLTRYILEERHAA